MTVSGIYPRIRALVSHATLPVRRKGWLHWLRFALLLVAGSYVGHLLSDSSRFNDWRYWLYQKQTTVLRRGSVYPRHTALVLLDDDDYWSDGYQARSRLKRDQLAMLLDRLNAAGVNIVAFDVFMDSPFPDRAEYEFPDYRQEDEAFFASLHRMCEAGRHVVLATEFWNRDNADSYEQPLIESPEIYMSRLGSLPCVSRGHVSLPESDFRTIPGTAKMDDGHVLDSLALAIIRLSDPIAYADLTHSQQNGFRFGRFLTPADFSTRGGRQFVFSGKEIQNVSIEQLRQQLADRTVIVGGHWRVAAYKVGDYVDMWNSPGGMEPGAMLHADYVEAMLDPSSSFIAISERAAEVLEWCLALGLAVLSALEIHSAWKIIGFGLGCLIALLVSYVLLQNLGIFLDFFIPIVIIVAHTVIEEIIELRHQLRHARHQLHAHLQPAHGKLGTPLK